MNENNKRSKLLPPKTWSKKTAKEIEKQILSQLDVALKQLEQEGFILEDDNGKKRNPLTVCIKDLLMALKTCRSIPLDQPKKREKKVDKKEQQLEPPTLPILDLP